MASLDRPSGAASAGDADAIADHIGRGRVIVEVRRYAHKGKEAPLAAIALVGGFALFALISVYFE